MHFNLILLQAEAQPGGGLQFLLMVGAIIAVFYFFMIRPQQKRQKQEQQFREGLQKGDRVTTIGGIYGKIVRVDEGTALIEVDNGVKLKMEKAALKAAPEQTENSK